MGQTRVQLNAVQGLGSFMKLEILLEGAETAQAGVGEAHELMALLDTAPSYLVEVSYVDLLFKSGI